MANNNLVLSLLITAKDQASGVLSGIRNAINGTAEQTGVLGSVARGITGTFGLLSGALAGVGFSAFLKSTVDAADALDELSQKTGVSVQALAGLQRLPDLAEVPIENVGNAINRLSKYMANNAEEAQKLGITAKDPVEAFYQLADVFSQTTSAQERAALGTKVLGKSYADLAPVLLQGGDALRSQVDAFAKQSGITSEVAARAGELNDKWTNLTNSARDFLTRGVLPVIPVLAKLVEYFQGFGKESSAVNASMSQSAPVFSMIAKILTGFTTTVELAALGIGALAAKLQAIATGNFSGLSAIDKAFSEDKEKAIARYVTLLDQLNTQQTQAPATNQAAEGVKQVYTEVDIALNKFKEWGDGSITAAQGVSDALKNLSDIELAKMKAALVEAFATGKNSSQELQEALSQIKTEEVTRAWKTLGQESSQSLQKAANEAKQAYVTIKESGQASAADLEKAWGAVEQKILAVTQAKNAQSEADRQRQDNLDSLDMIGATPQEQSDARRKQLTDETIAYDKAVRQGDYQEAVRIAQEKEKLAFENAQAETEAARAGEIAGYHAYDSKQKYMRAIEDTKKALEGLKEAEQATTTQQDNANTGDGQQNGEPAKTPLEIQQEAAAKFVENVKAINETPLKIAVETNLEEVNNQAETLLETLTKLNTVLGSKGKDGDLTQQLSDEALKRGAPS